MKSSLRFHLCDCMHLQVDGNRQAVVSLCFVLHPPDAVAPLEAAADALLRQFVLAETRTIATIERRPSPGEKEQDDESPLQLFHHCFSSLLS